LEARVARLESDVAHIRSDLAEVKATLNRLAPSIDEMRGFLTELRLQIMQQPTRRQSVFDIFAVVGLIGAIPTIAAHFAH